MAASPQVSAACFATDELTGHAIVDSGATRSTSGIQLMAHVQEEAWEARGSDLIGTDDTPEMLVVCSRADAEPHTVWTICEAQQQV